MAGSLHRPPATMLAVAALVVHAALLWPAAGDRECSGLVAEVAVAADGSVAELEAAALLAGFMGRLNSGGNESAAPLAVVSPAAAAGRPHLAVGTAAAAALGVPATALAGLGAEGFILSSNRTAEIRSTCAVVLAGAPNSTVAPIYAAQKLLRLLGVRFLAWDATHVPTIRPRIPYGGGGANRTTAVSAAWDIRFVPRFEYRNVDGWAALSHPAQARFLHLNDGPRSSAAAATGAVMLGSSSTGPGIRNSRRRPEHERSTAAAQQEPYADPPGFVHTSYNMLYDYGKFPPNENCSSSQCPPAELFKTHTEWFWPRNDSTVYGQLCWSNQSLIEYVC